MGLVANFAIRSGWIHRSGSNTSASGPQKVGLRWVRRGMYIMTVFFGMYKGISEASA
jgi:hypothetical protein